jgi:hypothetical protein
MKTNKRFLLVASLALALALTISCSSDDDDSPSLTFACEEDDYDEGRVCWEAYGGDKKYHAERCREKEGSAVNKCPKGYVKVCWNYKSSKADYKGFYYEERFRNMTCEEI